MLQATTTRVEANTSAALNDKFNALLHDNISRFSNADTEAIDIRLAELDREWNTERAIETEAPVMIGLGLALGAAYDRKWYALSAFSAGMMILHSLQGWYPLLPLLRHIGVRSQEEIEQERTALRVLRGDHEAYARD